MTVGTALSSAKCTFRRRGSSGEAVSVACGPRSLAGVPVVVVARPGAALPEACPGHRTVRGALPGGSRGFAATRVVQICHKGPDRAGAREKKRGISTILLRRPGAIGAFATDLDKPRRHGPRDGRHGSRRRPPGRPPDAETCTSHSNMQFQPSFSSAKCTSRRGKGWSRSSRTAAQIPLRNISGDPVRKAQ